MKKPFFFASIFLMSLFLFVKEFPAQNIKLENGLWFNGQEFEKKSVWIRDGKLSFKSSGRKIDQTIDISGKYVVPPYGEAHNHNLDSDNELQQRINKYLSHGVFYVKMQSSMKKLISPLMVNYNHAHGLDVSLAHAPITGTDGHPIALRKRLFDQGVYAAAFGSFKEIETHGFFIVDSSRDLSEKWQSILSFRPDFIKVILVHSEEYEKRKDDPSYFGQKGLNPRLLPDVVKRAHDIGLRVSVHVNTATDFHYAVMGGADEIAHLPGTTIEARIRPEDARMATKRNIVVVTTAGLVKRKSKDPNYEKILEAVRYNLKTLKEAGVKLAIGSDEYNDTSFTEATFLSETGIFSNLELLTMWSEISAKTIFPKRRVGRLENGYEASFLVLEGNPLEDWTNTQRIGMKMKQGIILK